MIRKYNYVSGTTSIYIPQQIDSHYNRFAILCKDGLSIIFVMKSGYVMSYNYKNKGLTRDQRREKHDYDYEVEEEEQANTQGYQSNACT